MSNNFISTRLLRFNKEVCDVIDGSNQNIISTHLLRFNTEVCDVTDGSNQNIIKDIFEDKCKIKSKVQSDYIDTFKGTLNYDGERYISRLPFVENPEELPCKYILTKNRTENLIKKLRKDPELLKEYSNIIDEYIQEGILEEVPTIHKTNAVHYLPHRAVVPEERETTKVRIVFDASAKYQNQFSLNDILDPGPCLLPYISDILIRFRLGKIGVAADTRKAFLPIAINKNDRDYLRMIWFDNLFIENAEIKILRFARLVFGLSSSPFVLNGTVKIHLEKFINDEQKRKVIIKLLRDLYVDDITSSVNDAK